MQNQSLHFHDKSNLRLAFSMATILQGRPAHYKAFGAVLRGMANPNLEITLQLYIKRISSYNMRINTYIIYFSVAW